jgi:hypothetical protein
MPHFGAIGNQLVIEDVAIIRLVDHRRSLHRFRGKAHFVADQPGPGLDLALRNLGRDRVGILYGDVRKCDVQLRCLLSVPLCRHQNISGFFSVGVGQHVSPLAVVETILYRLFAENQMVVARRSAGPRGKLAVNEGQNTRKRTTQEGHIDCKQRQSQGQHPEAENRQDDA